MGSQTNYEELKGTAAQTAQRNRLSSQTNYEELKCRFFNPVVS